MKQAFGVQSAIDSFSRLFRERSDTRDERSSREDTFKHIITADSSDNTIPYNFNNKFPFKAFLDQKK